MSRFATSDEYFRAQDEFRRYVETEVNPARVKHGLSEIRDAEARECFRIIDEFLDDWMKPSNRLADQTPAGPAK
jgi:hypothetical protein